MAQLHRALLISIMTSALTLWAQNASALDSSYLLQDSVHEQPLQLVSSLSFLSLARTTQSITGLEFGLGLNYALNPKWSLGGGYRQGFNSIGFSSIYSALEVKLIHALTGDLLRRSHKTQLDQTDVYTETSTNRGGLRAELAFSQYFFNGTTSIYPYSGLGAGILYEFTFQSPFGLRTGVRADTSSDGKNTLNIIQGVVEGIFWF